MRIRIRYHIGTKGPDFGANSTALIAPGLKQRELETLLGRSLNSDTGDCEGGETDKNEDLDAVLGRKYPGVPGSNPDAATNATSLVDD